MPSEDFKPWLMQGDIFGDVPVVEPKLSEWGTISSSVAHGAALLVTENCILAKRTTRRKQPKVARLHFAPIRLLADLDLDATTIDRAKRRTVNPPEPVYLDLTNWGSGECVAVLGQMYHLPIEYFGELVPENDDDDPDDPFRVSITQNDSRVATMDKAEWQDLIAKMAFFWLHGDPPAPR